MPDIVYTFPGFQGKWEGQSSQVMAITDGSKVVSNFRVLNTLDVSFNNKKIITHETIQD